MRKAWLSGIAWPEATRLKGGDGLICSNTLVAGYPQPEWLIDSGKRLAGALSRRGFVAPRRCGGARAVPCLSAGLCDDHAIKAQKTPASTLITDGEIAARVIEPIFNRTRGHRPRQSRAPSSIGRRDILNPVPRVVGGSFAGPGGPAAPARPRGPRPAPARWGVARRRGGSCSFRRRHPSARQGDGARPFTMAAQARIDH